MKKGYGSVFMVIILSCMIAVTLTFAEASSYYAAESRMENMCLLTGKALLSEYKKELFDRYGLFMVRGYDDELSKLASFYLTADTALSPGALDLHMISADVDSSSFSGLDTDMFLDRVQTLGELEAARELISEGYLIRMLAAVDKRLNTGFMSDDLSERLSKLTSQDGPAGGDDPEAKETRAQARELKEKYKEASKEGVSKDVSSAKIPAAIKADLPSQLMGYRGRNLLIISGGAEDLSPRDLFLDEYILGVCSDLADPRKDTFLRLETEYILYGGSSDSLNQKLVRNSLYGLRFSLNMFSIFTEPDLLSSVASVAAMFPLLPRTLVTAAAGTIWAFIETKDDIKVLFDGGTVPVLKDKFDFRTSIIGFITGKAYGASGSGSGKYGTYRDYLRLLLLMVPEKEKAARLMDIMELNVTQMDGTAFSFRDYVYGFELKAGFVRNHFAENPFKKQGVSYVVQTHEYN